ncbi:MAG TPA: hypothetical protein VF422_07320 [Dokdonella sp.]
MAALAARDAARDAIDARETGLRQVVRARDHGSLLEPLRWLLAAGATPTVGAADPAVAW